MLDVCLLGTGGMVPLPDRWLTSLLLRYNGKMLLIDCGEGTQIPLKMCGWGFKAIDAILFTHFHADHVAGLPGLLLTLGNSGRTEKLTLVGPPGLEYVVRGLLVISPQLPYDIRIVELPDNEAAELSLGEFAVSSLPIDHWIPCLAYSVEIKRQGKFNAEQAKKLDIPVFYWSRLQKGETIKIGNRDISPKMVLGQPRRGIKVSYCTDTRPTAELPDFIKASDLFICEGMYNDNAELEKARQKRHMLFSEAAMLAKMGSVKELWLTHYSPSLEKPQEGISAATEVFENTLAGYDLITKSIKFKEDS